MIKLRKLTILLLTCIIPIGMSGCSALSSLIPFTPSRNIADPNTYINEFKDNRQYATLDSRLQECYGTLYTALTDGFDTDDTVTIADAGESTSIGIAVELPIELSSEKDPQTLYTAFFYDNPQFFYINNTYGLEGYEADGRSHYNKLVFTYTMNADARKDAKAELDKAVETILQGVPQTTDQYEIELYLHNKLAVGCTYDTAAANAGYSSAPNAYTAYGALVDGQAVCEGYSRAMQLLLNKAGITNTLVIGESLSDNEKHMWNLVSINGDFYHLDATWNDSDDQLRHNYFNVTTAQLALSRRITDGQAGIVNCTATKDNYFYRNGLVIDTYSRQTIAQKIATHIKKGETQIELLFAPDKFDNALLFLKNRRAAEEQIGPYLVGSGYSLWEYVLYSDADEHILCIRKNHDPNSKAGPQGSCGPASLCDKFTESLPRQADPHRRCHLRKPPTRCRCSERKRVPSQSADLPSPAA